MNSWWIVSLIVLWVLVCVVAVTEVVLLRQMGLLYLRLGGSLGALQDSSGPQLGAGLPIGQVFDQTGVLRSLVPPRGQQKILVFMSPTCSLCDVLIPELPAFAHSVRTAAELLVLLSADDRTGKLAGWRPGRPPVVVDPSLMDIFEIPSLPYAVTVNDAGRVASKGLINDLVQLDSLLNEAAETPGTLRSSVDDGRRQSESVAVE